MAHVDIPKHVQIARVPEISLSLVRCSFSVGTVRKLLSRQSGMSARWICPLGNSYVEAAQRHDLLLLGVQITLL